MLRFCGFFGGAAILRPTLTAKRPPFWGGRLASGQWTGSIGPRTEPRRSTCDPLRSNCSSTAVPFCLLGVVDGFLGGFRRSGRGLVDLQQLVADADAGVCCGRVHLHRRHHNVAASVARPQAEIGKREARRLGASPVALARTGSARVVLESGDVDLQRLLAAIADDLHVARRAGLGVGDGAGEVLDVVDRAVAEGQDDVAFAQAGLGGRAVRRSPSSPSRLWRRQVSGWRRYPASPARCRRRASRAGPSRVSMICCTIPLAAPKGSRSRRRRYRPIGE